MGVDYDANFGLGYEIMFPESWNGKEDYDEWEFLDFLLKDVPYSYIWWGDQCYTGDPNTYAIVLDETPNRVELSDKLWELEKFLKEKGIDYDSSTYLVGGLEVN